MYSLINYHNVIEGSCRGTLFGMILGLPCMKILVKNPETIDPHE